MTRRDHTHAGGETPPSRTARQDVRAIARAAAFTLGRTGGAHSPANIRTVFLLTALAACLLLTACAPVSLSHPAPEKRFYTIQAQRHEAAAPSRDKTVLKVRPIRVSPAYQGKEMVYRLGESEYEPDYYNVFFVQPAQNIAQETHQWLDRSGLFGGVVDSTSQVADTHLLEGAVNALYADFRDKSAPKAVLEMQFFLLKNSRESYQVVFSKSYREEVPFPADFKDASGLAAAYGQALGAILTRLEADLRAAR